MTKIEKEELDKATSKIIRMIEEMTDEEFWSRFGQKDRINRNEILTEENQEVKNNFQEDTNNYEYE